MKQRKHRHTGPYDPQTITRAVTHIRLEAANAGKLTALDDLAQVYLALCQQYVTLFCTNERPNKLRAPLFATSLSERWQRVAIQQAAGIAQSWRTNRAQAYQDYADDLLDYHEQETEGTLQAGAHEPTWREWHIPVLRQTCIQANINVVELGPAQDSTFDYWLTISTLEFRKQLLVPVRLAAYHREALKGKTINTSVTLNKRGDGWWLTLSYDQVVPVHTAPSAPVVGVDVGIANFVTTSTGKHYGTFHGKLRERQKRDREKRRRKAKLRKCLEKKGVKKLPSTSSKSGQRLARHVRQEINRAVNQCFTEHEDCAVRLRTPLRGHHEVQGACHERLFVRLQPGAHPQANSLECRQTRQSSNQGQERLLLAGVQCVSLSRQSQPAQPANVLLCGLWLQHACRSQRGDQH